MASELRSPKKGSGSTLLLACGALAHELIALNRANQWECFTVECIPATIHWSPEKIPDAVRNKIHSARERFEKIYVLFGDCGTAGELDKVLEEENVERIPGPHCFSFLAGNDHFESMSEGDGLSAFYFTDFVVKHFDKFIWEGLWLDRHPELLEMYFGNYTKAIYTAQVKDEKLEEKARRCAQKMGLEYEYRFTGYGDLAIHLHTVSS
ncbi:MAG: DUF1638 domain-containing protein [Pseudomonadota bacterium]